MKIEVLDSADLVAQKAAGFIALEARQAVDTRGCFTFAVSGGTTPWQMLRCLAREKIPWEAVHIIQADERLAPAGHTDRNLTHLRKGMLGQVPMLPVQIHAMPVVENDPETAAASYAATLRDIAGSPAVLDLVHLGLGPDGHTASLLPGDPVLDITDRDVAPTGIYQDRRRLTLTYPIINRARKILWLITGSEKSIMLKRLLEGDLSIPAGRISQVQAIVLADKDAADK